MALLKTIIFHIECAPETRGNVLSFPKISSQVLTNPVSSQEYLFFISQTLVLKGWNLSQDRIIPFASWLFIQVQLRPYGTHKSLSEMQDKCHETYEEIVKPQLKV